MNKIGQPTALSVLSPKSIRILTALLLLPASQLMVAQDIPADSEDDASVPGLIAEYRDSTGHIENRTIVPRPLYNAVTGASLLNPPPSPSTADGPVQITWRGNLLIREDANFRFHATIVGKVAVLIADHLVLNCESLSSEFKSGSPVSLLPGEHPLEIRFECDAASLASEHQPTLQIFWSSEKFTLEPLPADILSCVPGEETTSLQTKMRGHLLAESLRCGTCHPSLTAYENLPAPALDRVMTGHDPAALKKRLMNPNSVVAGSRMPTFGFSASEAEDIAAFLQSVSKDIKTSTVPTAKDQDAENGVVLLRSVGCVACHELPGIPAEHAEAVGRRLVSSPAAGPSLKGVGNRRSASWLFQWLTEPAQLNPQHRMPVFQLTSDERRQITAALSQSTDTSELQGDGVDSGTPLPESRPNAGTERSQQSLAPASPAAEQIAAGRQLIMHAQCFACHQIPGFEVVERRVIPVPKAQNAADLAGCLRDPAFPSDSRSKPELKPASKSSASAALRIPAFVISQQQRSDLAAWIAASASGAPHPHLVSNSIEKGDWLLIKNGCTACHDRDQYRGLSAIASRMETTHENLRGRSQSLIPPALTAVGDKLTDDFLKTAVSGKQTDRRLPWLSVRMPRFQHTDQELQELVQSLITADRIPDAADSARPEIAEAASSGKATAQDLLTGNQLTGAAGFNCVACHSAGSFEPRNVALGTRGSDLLTMGSRLRPRFFHRWMKNPIRVIAGIEMPAIKRGAPGILNESLPDQISLIWRAISDPKFTAPTVVSRYEQFVTVAPGAAPRMIRDVFTIGESKQRKGVARAMAVGFENGHNLLIDLDTMQILQWTVGEFARQRTEGKSWFWSMAGITVATASSPAPQATSAFELVSPGLSETSAVPAVVDEARSTELLRYSSDHEGLDLWYQVHFATPQTGSATDDSSAAGKPADSKSSPHDSVTAWNDPKRPVRSFTIHERIIPVREGVQTGWKRALTLVDSAEDEVIRVSFPALKADSGFAVHPQIRQTPVSPDSQTGTAGNGSGLLKQGIVLEWLVTTTTQLPVVSPPELPKIITSSQAVTSTPGLDGTRLPIDASIMPTAITWLPDGRMAFTSLRGHVWIARDTDGDHLEDQLTLFEEGLAAPFGILADGDSILVSHKPEVLRLRDTDGDGRADQREVVASGWGYSDDYHDWTSGLIRDDEQNLYVGLGSDYSQKDRAKDRDRWRGTVLKIDPSGNPTPVAFAFRYPMSLAFDGRGRLYATDNQGVQNTFNEINHIVPGTYYGVPSRHDVADAIHQETPALQVPHPWTRSVNSILFFPENFGIPQLAGHGLGCEYDLRFLIRFSLQETDGVMQGAVYPFSRANLEAGGSNFIGPICSAVSPDGALYIGSIWDSGWQGGPNTGGITRLVPAATRPNGIREVVATNDGLTIHFLDPVDSKTAAEAGSYSVQGYTRVWGGNYATPDSDHHQIAVRVADVASDGRSVHLTLPGMKAGYVYDVSLVGGLLQSQEFWPATAHYTLKRIPSAKVGLNR